MTFLVFSKVPVVAPVENLMKNRKQLNKLILFENEQQRSLKSLYSRGQL
jgi:hypothetical protein